jgi:hypothetical protein
MPTPTSFMIESAIPEKDLDEIRTLAAKMNGNKSVVLGGKQSSVFSAFYDSFDADKPKGEAATYANQIVQSLNDLNRCFAEKNTDNIENQLQLFQKQLRRISKSREQNNPDLIELVNKSKKIAQELSSNPIHVFSKRQQELQDFMEQKKEAILFDILGNQLAETIDDARMAINQDIKNEIAKHPKKSNSYLCFFRKSNQVTDVQLEMAKIPPARHQFYEKMRLLLNSVSYILNIGTTNTDALVHQAGSASVFLKTKITPLKKEYMEKGEFNTLLNALDGMSKEIISTIRLFPEIKSKLETAIALIVNRHALDEFATFKKIPLGQHLQNLLLLNDFYKPENLSEPINQGLLRELQQNVSKSHDDLSKSELAKFKHFDLRDKSTTDILLHMLPEETAARFIAGIKEAITQMGRGLINPAAPTEDMAQTIKNPGNSQRG